MDSVESLQSAWIFDSKGNLKESKNEKDKEEGKKIYAIAQ